MAISGSYYLIDKIQQEEIRVPTIKDHTTWKLDQCNRSL